MSMLVLLVQGPAALRMKNQNSSGNAAASVPPNHSLVPAQSGMQTYHLVSEIGVTLTGNGLTGTSLNGRETPEGMITWTEAGHLLLWRIIDVYLNMSGVIGATKGTAVAVRLTERMKAGDPHGHRTRRTAGAEIDGRCSDD